MLTLTVLFEDGPGDTMVVRAVGDVPRPVLAVFAVACGALYWRRRAPLRVVAIVLVGWAVLLGSGFAHLGGAAIVALYSAGRYSDRDGWGEAGAMAATLVVILDGILADLPTSEMVAGGVVMFGAWFFGRSRRLRAERAEQARRELEGEAQRVVAEERVRIARELHDVVAHRVSLMTVQAGAARAVAGRDPAAAERAMAAVEEAGRQALDELRHLLGVLRPQVDDLARDPQPGVGDVPRLAERVRDAGVDVVLSLRDVPSELPARVELSAYRIVQEALTNVLKHGGTGVRAEVRVRGDGQRLAIEIVDDGGARTPVDAAALVPALADGRSAGHGIVGMRERALLLGGDLDAGPAAGGGFRVVAHLPVDGGGP